jgi:hypothetical protein
MCAVTRLDMLLKLEMQKRPELFVAAQNDMTTTASITSIGPALWNVFFATKVRRATSTVSGSTVNFYVINKVV